MSNLATRQLIEAAAGLQAADRALLNLWIHRGLDDERLAGLTGMSAVAVLARRERILALLGEQLGASREQVLGALHASASEDPGRPEFTATGGGLASVATSSSTGLPQPPPAGGVPVAATEPPVPEGPDPGYPPAQPGAEAVGDTPPPETEASAPLPPGAENPAAEAAEVAVDSSNRRGRIWVGVTAAVAIVVAVVLVVLLSGGSSSHDAPDPAPPPTTSATAPPAGATTPATGTATAPTSTATATSQQTTSTTTTGKDSLSGLPGGPKHLTGVVRLVGTVGHLKLRLTVKGLPRVHHEYYAVWLFNSVIRSRRLGRVTRNVANTYQLPHGARRFRFIDISVQPKGTTSHSGASRLRAINPVHGPRTTSRKARASAHHRAPAAHRRGETRTRKASTSK